MAEELSLLLKELRGKIFGKRGISATYSDKGLELWLDLKIGLDGLEILSADKPKDEYIFDYFALQEVANNTFLSGAYDEHIEKSDLLKKIRDEARTSSEKPDAERYPRNFACSAKTQDFQQVRDAFYNMCEIYMLKAKDSA